MPDLRQLNLQRLVIRMSQDGLNGFVIQGLWVVN